MTHVLTVGDTKSKPMTEKEAKRLYKRMRKLFNCLEITEVQSDTRTENMA